MDLFSFTLGKKLGGGGGKPAVIEPLSVTENGTYTPPEGVDGYAPVKVEIVDPPTAYSLQDFINARGSCDYLFYDKDYSEARRGYVTDEVVANTMLGLDMSNITLMRYMFAFSSITKCPSFDTSKVTDMTSMFYNCNVLTEVPLFDTSNVTNMQNMFRYCTKLVKAPLSDTSNVTNMYGMFDGCKALVEAPQLDISKVTDMNSLFNNCESLVELPLLDTSKITSMQQTVQGCKSLVTIPQWDIRSVKSAISISGCVAITEVWFRNIKAALYVGSGTYYGHLLTVESLIHLIYELRDTDSVKTLTVGKANLEKLASVYVKTIEVTDEMLAEDDLVNEKLPFEVCESTDEGATLITEYVLFKNWKIA